MYFITMIAYRKFFCYHNNQIMLPTSLAIYIIYIYVIKKYNEKGTAYMCYKAFKLDLQNHSY